MDAAKPKVLFVYFSYTQQTKKIVDAMAEVLQGRGCDTEVAAIEFLDPRYAKRFETFPMPHPLREVLGMIPAELLRKPGKINIPDVVTDGEYDLVCIGSPTWWLSTNVPIKAFLESDAAGKVLDGTKFTGAVACRRYWKHNLKTLRRRGTKRGGTWIDGIHFRYQGGQVRSLLSLISYLGSGEYREKYLGLKIPPTNLYGSQLDEARSYAGKLAISSYPTDPSPKLWRAAREAASCSSWAPWHGYLPELRSRSTVGAELLDRRRGQRHLRDRRFHDHGQPNRVDRIRPSEQRRVDQGRLLRPKPRRDRLVLGVPDGSLRPTEHLRVESHHRRRHERGPAAAGVGVIGNLK